MRPTALAVAALALLAAPPRAAAQIGTTTDIITGTVTGADSQPLAGAVVQAVSLESRVSRERTTDARGRFTIVFPDGGGRYQLVVRFIGMAPASLTVARRDDEDRLVADVQMGLAAVPLAAVTVHGRRGGGGSDQSGAGASGRSLKPEHLTRLPVDAADMNAVATLAPGVLGLAGTDSSATAFSVAGQRPTANNVTLDGMTLGAAVVPQDAVRTIRVVTNSYDVARGHYSGGLVQSTTRSGTNVPEGSFTLTLRDRSLAWGEPTPSPFGQGATQDQLSGGFGGPLVPDRLFVFAALQGRWRAQALPSLATVDPGTLERLGVSPDSVTRFLGLAAATGAPATAAGVPSDRATDELVGLLRLDWQVGDAHTLTLRFDGARASQEPTHVGALALPVTGGTRSEAGGGVMAALTSALSGHFINELRGYLSRDRRELSAYLALPAAHVQVGSSFPNSENGVVTLAFGGNNGLPQRLDDGRLEVTDELSWLPGSGEHRVKLGAYVSGTRIGDDVTANRFGTYTFPSLAALAADSPSAFTRTLAPLDQRGTARESALYLGDTWRAGGRLFLTYGLRLEVAGFHGAPPYNRAVDSLFGIRTDRLPSERHVSPRVGFTWAVAGGPDERYATFLRGGAGDFRSPIPTTLYAAALDAPGSSQGETELECVGAQVPTPDWTQYAQDPSTIPSQCVDTAAAVTVTPAPNVTVFAPGYGAPRARRAALGLVQRFLANYWLTVEASYARGVSQYGFRDLNLVATPRFTLPDEANRPVYVPAGAIVPATGAVSIADSRVDSGLGRVLVIGSDLQSDTKQLTVSFAGATSRGASLRISYTYTRARDQSSFGCCAAAQGFAAPTTAGDPNAREWATSELERRHSLFAVVTYPIARGLDIAAIARLASGTPFTPIVGSDINGDGARNDRAFVFDPATAADTAVARGMRELLAGAAPAVRACLERQIGRIGGRNSCTGPWQPSLDLQLNWRPAWLADRRLTLSLVTVNLLGGLDEWLHGAANLHGWGYSSVPDPVLLYVQGFDPSASRYRYAVNGRFGTIASASSGIILPFQIALQGHLSIGPPPLRALPPAR